MLCGGPGRELEPGQEAAVEVQGGAGGKDGRKHIRPGEAEAPTRKCGGGEDVGVGQEGGKARWSHIGDWPSIIVVVGA